MKKILAKIAGIITIFAMTFSPVLAQQVQIDENPDESCQEVSTVYKSGTTTQVDSHDAVLVTQPVNAGWTASIAGADWIWSEADVLDATVDTTKEFTQTFTFEDAPSDVVLDIAADNSYIIKVNGVEVEADATEFNYKAEGQDNYTIPASAFVTGSNTVTFIVKNWALADSTPQTNPAGLMYKFTVNDCQGADEDNCNEDSITEENDCDEEPVCEYTGNLLVNGGFEAPVAPAGGWDEYDSGTPGLGWNVAWNGVFAGAPAIAKLELHHGVNGWVSEEGLQHAELDADWGYNNNEKASVKIWQTVNTVEGVDYVLSYAFSPRPGTGASENVLEVYINGNLVNTHGPVAGVGNTSWNTYTVDFEGTGSDVIEFRDAGTPNTLGTLLDDVSVNCEGEDEPEVCTQGAPLYARVKINTNDATKWRNWNGGNLNAGTPFFVGGTNPLPHGSGGNVYMGNEWFPLTNADGSFINDTNNLDFAVNSNVPGVAVQRMNGAIRVVLYGNHSDASGGKELAAGSIELSTDASARLLGAWDKPNGFYDPISNDAHTGTRLHDVTVNDAANPMDSRGNFKAYINQYDPRFDNVGVNSDLFQFHLVATSGTDGFFARYNFDDMIEVPCDEVVIPQ